MWLNIPDVWAQSSASQSHFSVHRWIGVSRLTEPPIRCSEHSTFRRSARLPHLGAYPIPQTEQMFHMREHLFRRSAHCFLPPFRSSSVPIFRAVLLSAVRAWIPKIGAISISHLRAILPHSEHAFRCMFPVAFRLLSMASIRRAIGFRHFRCRSTQLSSFLYR